MSNSKMTKEARKGLALFVREMAELGLLERDMRMTWPDGSWLTVSVRITDAGESDETTDQRSR